METSISSTMKVVLFLLKTVLVFGYPSGAPTRACNGLLPVHHGTAPQSSQAPFEIGVSSAQYSAGSTITVQIRSKGSQSFMAYLLQARVQGQNSSSVGLFTSPPANSKLLTCFSAGDSVTHSSATPKTIIEFQWTAPSSNVGQIEILGTVALSKQMYWGVMSSGPLTFSGTANPPTSSTMTSTARSTESGTSPPEAETTIDNGSSSASTSGLTLMCTLLIVVKYVTNRK